MATQGDKQLVDAASKVSCIKLTPKILHGLYAIKIGFCAEQLALPSTYMTLINSVPEIKFNYNSSRNKLEKNSKSIKSGEATGLAYKQYLIDSVSMLQGLKSLAEMDEQYQLKGGKVYRTNKLMKVIDYLDFFNNNELRLNNGDWEFNFGYSSKFKFLNKGENIPEYRRYQSKTYSADYTYYHKVKNSYQKVDINSKTFNPNDQYYVGVEVNCESLKQMILSIWKQVFDLLSDNVDLLSEYNKITTKSLAPKVDKYSITTSDAWNTKNSHRTKQSLLISIKDSRNGLYSNAFATKWNSTPGEEFKMTAAALMLNIERLFKEGPKLISTSVQAIFEPMGAVIVSAVGPATCATNILQIMGTITRIVTTASALASLVVTTMSQFDVLGIGDSTPSLKPIIKTLSVVTGVIVTLNSILSKLPQL